MASSGSGEDSTVLRSGMATVKPISAIMPRIPEPATAHRTPRGTLLRGLTASSDMSAASSNPTRVNAPSRPASANAYQVGLWLTDAVLVRMPAPYGVGLDFTPHRMNSSTPNRTVPMISVNTATLLTRAATWMLMMLMNTGRTIRMIATVSTRRGLGSLTLNSDRSSGEATPSMIAPPPTAMYSRPAKPTNQPYVGF